ncbi:MAG: histone deacetylase [Nocardioides sp.]
MTGPVATDDPVWYVAYGSNLSAERLRCYLAGGRPPGARRSYQGCRDPAPPTADVLLRLPGRIVFAGESRVWGGAMAFYDPTADQEVVARGYRITFGQLSDVVSQEARHPVGNDLTPAQVDGEPWETPSHVYESLIRLGDRDGTPMVSLTSLQELRPAPPSADYLRTILRGLAEIWPSTPWMRSCYLAEALGVAPTWSAATLYDLTLI